MGFMIDYAGCSGDDEEERKAEARRHTRAAEQRVGEMRRFNQNFEKMVKRLEATGQIIPEPEATPAEWPYGD